VSCHVERPLDDAVWARFSALQEARPGGFAVAALLRPADAAFGEEESVWLERARDAASRGPLGHHTHWTAPDHARPTALATDCHERDSSLSEGETGLATDCYKRELASNAGEGKLATGCYELPGERVRAEGRELGAHGVSPTLFCGGGWYTDAGVAEACAELGYVDCTLRATRPPYLLDGERWASAAAPARIELPTGAELAAIPTTHSLGDLARALRRRALPALVHVYFHDTDLLSARRRALLHTTLRLLAGRAEVTDLDSLAAHALPVAPRVAWADVARL
jgi:hypothetical protein